MTVVRLIGLVVSCCALGTACGAGDNRLDPGDLELRDLLGISPEAASTWDHDQRASAHRVIEDGLHQPPASPIRASLGNDAGLDRQVTKALASVDADRARHHAAALGVVHVAIGPGSVLATARAATLEPHPTAPVSIQLVGWDAEPVLQALPARGPGVLAAIAVDAGHTSGPLVVTPAPQLAVVAGYIPATTTDPARLVVNPVLLAALEPQGTASTPPAAPPAAPEVAARSSNPPAHAALPKVAADGPGNPYSFYGSVAECASAQRARCESCLAASSCRPVTNSGDGNAECTQLAEHDGRGYSLICINLALAIDSVSSCTAGRAASCARDPHASESLSSLENNAGFLDDVACSGPLDTCLATLYGPSQGGADPAQPPRNTSVDCSDSFSNDPNCDASPGCELDGPSCDGPESSDTGCSDSNEQSSGCDDGSQDGGGCSSDSSGNGCDSGDGGSCSNGSGDGGSCDSGSGGGGCSSGDSGNCDSGGGGGDCSGGDSSCNVAPRHGRHGGGTLPIAVLWALLPIPFATRVRRRAERRKARAAADGEVPS